MPRLAMTAVALCCATACGEPDLSCGEGTEPQIVTGLSGVLDDGRPAVEIQLRQPMDCMVLDTSWMFWNEATESVTLEEAPTSGTLDRSVIQAGDDIIAWNGLNLGVRLDYRGAEIGPEVSLVWFSSGVDIAFVDCAADVDALSCTVRP